jgi:hypothetical protein
MLVKPSAHCSSSVLSSIMPYDGFDGLFDAAFDGLFDGINTIFD